MQNNQEPPLPEPTPEIQGDPATSRFAWYFLGSLAVLLFGVGVGIGVGNISHYRYFGPYDQRSLTSLLTNFSIPANN